MKAQVKAVAATSYLEQYRAMSRGKKMVLTVFVIRALQAIPKWTAAIVADGETSAAIMKVFVTPR